MPAGKFDTTWEQGTTIDKTFTWHGPTPEGEPEGTPGSPIDLTGYTARMQIRATQKSTVILHEFTTENGGIELGGENGTIRVKASAAQTAAWSWPTRGRSSKATALYDLKLIDSAGGEIRLFEGKITLVSGVTR